MKTLFTIALLLVAASTHSQMQKVDIKLDWHAPVGFETNGLYNIRYPASGSLMSDWKTWPIVATVGPNVSHVNYNVWETQMFAITHTNPVTGIESTEGLQPIYSQSFLRTNGALTRVDVPEPRLAVGNYYVDYATGSDTNTGTNTSSPWKHCRTDLSPGSIVTLKGGVPYYGSIEVASGVTYYGTSPWGGGKAILDGTVLITTPWLHCTNAVDAGGNTNWSKIWWTVVPSGVSNCLPTMICNGSLSQWSQEPDPSDKIFWEVLSEWRTVSPTNIGTTWLIDTQNLTQPNGFYDETFVATWVQGNATVVVPITNYVQDSHMIWFANGTPTYTDRNGYYALINHPQFLDVAGEWAVRMKDNRLYLYPISGDPNTQEIGIARKGSAFTGFAHDVTISGFSARGYYQPPNEVGYSGQFCAIGNSDWVTHNIVVLNNNLHFFKSFNSAPIIDIQRGSNAIVALNHIHDNLISRGMLLNGIRGAAVTNNNVRRINGTGIYLNGSTNSIVSNNTVSDIIGIHGNGISVYGNCTNVTVSGNLISNCTSLLTYEQSADVTFINNVIDANGKDYRVAEWGGTWGPIRWYNNSLVNNPDGTMMSQASTTAPGASFTNVNNIISGGGRSNQQYNIYTKLAWFQDASYGWKLGTGESVADPSLVFANTNTHNWQSRSNSPAINKGIPLTNVFTKDYAGVVRGSTWDIGAYEATNPPAGNPQYLVLSWQGPPGWQTNGGLFNLRGFTTGSVVSAPLTWPLSRRVTNILTTTFSNVNISQWFAISFTNSALGMESAEGISPVTGQYNWQ